MKLLYVFIAFTLALSVTVQATDLADILTEIHDNWGRKDSEAWVFFFHILYSIKHLCRQVG